MGKCNHFASKKNVLGVIRSNGSIYVEDLDTKNIIEINDWRWHCGAFALNPEGNLLACGGSYEKLYVWDIAKKQLLESISGAKYVSSVAWSPDGKWIATGDSNGTVRLGTVLVENPFV